MNGDNPRSAPVSILYKSIAGRYRPVRVADGPITARYRFRKNVLTILILKFEQVHLTTCSKCVLDC